MSVADKTGRMHHSASRARLHDDMAADKAAKPMDKKPMAGDESGDSGNSSEPIENIVSEHGPAHEVHYMKDKETGKHKVHSKHGEGNVEHKSEHDSEQEAHKEIGKAMGGDPAEENPDEEMGEEAGEMMPQEEAHGRIPGLK